MRVLVPVAALFLCLACNTQRWPGPMKSPDPLPPGVDAGVVSGPADVILYRHADPVQLRRPPSMTPFPLTFYSKRERIRSGSWVYCGAGGRAELLWAADGANLIVFDEAILRLGDPKQGEPDVRFSILTRAEISLASGAVVELPGGSQLSGPVGEDTGPYLVERIYEEIMRLFNRSKRPAYLSFRDSRLVLAPGERVDLPLLEAGGTPFDLGGPPKEVQSAGISGALFGNLTFASDDTGLRATASGPGVLSGNGVAVDLVAGEEATLLPLAP